MTSMKQFTHNEHFVPKFYLKKFSAANGKSIETLDTVTDTISIKKLKEICMVRDLYESKIGPGDNSEAYLLPNELENALKVQENKYNVAISHAVAAAMGSDEISRDDISLIADFAITTLLRNPRTLKNAQQLLRSGITDRDGFEELRQFSNNFFGGRYPVDVVFEALQSTAERRIILNETSRCGKEYIPRNDMKADLMGMGFSLLKSPLAESWFRQFPASSRAL